MKTTTLMIAAALMLTACGGEETVTSIPVAGDPQSISGPIVEGRYGLMNIKSTNQAGLSTDLNFVGLLRFEYQLVGRDALTDTYRETIFGTVTMGQDKLDCGDIQHAEVIMDNAGEVLSYKVLANACTRSGIFTKPVGSPIMGTETTSNELVWRVAGGGTNLEFRANLMQL